jgi:CxxC-x17-CxxC domain-containing protein
MDQDRQMFEVNEKCGECGAAITQLPFQPSGDRALKCRDCYRSGRPQGGNNNRGPRQMYDVDINCAECGTRITQLPFQPSGDRPVFCFDCNKAKRGN